MRTLNNCKIYFDNPSRIYRPGNHLTGHIETNFNSNKTARGIIIEISGRATVYWSQCYYNHSAPILSDSKNTSIIPNFVSYTNKEKYIAENFYIVGKKDESIELKSGYHVYRFKYLLPLHLPPTFEGTAGKIKYVVRAILDRAWKNNKYVEESFVIDTLCHIYQHPMAQLPNTVRIEKQFGLILKSKPLKTIVKATSSGFAPGDDIPLTAEVINNSHVVIKHILVTLTQVLTFHSTSSHKKEKKLLSKNNVKCQVKPNESNSFNLILNVPRNIILYDLTDCRIMNCDYKIKVELRTFGPHRNLTGWMPMYPLKSTNFANELNNMQIN